MIEKRNKRISDELLREFSPLSSATIYEGNLRRGALDSDIKALAPQMKCCGRALTVKCQPGDNLTLLTAMHLAGPGDVIVCDCGGIKELGHWGDLMSAQAVASGIAGLVINGGVRDSEDLEALGFPVFCRNVCIKGSNKKAFGAINQPICVGGVAVNPGDLICADRDGVTLVRYEELDRALAGAQERAAKETKIRVRIAAGERMFEIMDFGRYLPEEARQQIETIGVGEI